MEFKSTAEITSKLEIKTAELNSKLKSIGWIEKKDERWLLTDLGKEKGGQKRMSAKYGEFLVWPENIKIENTNLIDKSKLINATVIGKHFNISSQRLNLILSEFGWIEKDISGWTVTKLGKSVGGRKFEHETSGGSYVLWPENILQNINLVEVFANNQTEKETINSDKNPITSQIIEQQLSVKTTSNNFREKFEAKHRTKDGHFVRSRAEVIIDDTLYDYGLVHAYEKKVPIEEELYTDFYLPNGKVYIEFWGMEGDSKYLERKNKKLEIYKKYDLKLIELDDDDILNLDDNLPKKLLKYGIKVY